MKFAALAFAAIGVLAVGSLLFVVLIPGLICENTLVKEVFSPSGGMKAVVFQRECSSSEDSSTQVSINPAEAGFPGGVGNTYIARAKMQTEKHVSLNGPFVQVRWRGEATLEISHHQGDRVFLAERMIDGIDVEYDYTAAPQI